MYLHLHPLINIYNLWKCCTSLDISSIFHHISLGNNTTFSAICNTNWLRQRICSCGRVQSNHPWTLTPKTKWNCPPRLRWYRSRNRQMTKTRMPSIQSSLQLSMIGCLERRMLTAWRACRHMSSPGSSKPMSTRWESKILIETNLSSRVNLLLLTSIERIVWRGSIRTTRNWHWREVLRKRSRWGQLLHK